MRSGYWLNNVLVYIIHYYNEEMVDLIVKAFSVKWIVCLFNCMSSISKIPSVSNFQVPLFKGVQLYILGINEYFFVNSLSKAFNFLPSYLAHTLPRECLWSKVKWPWTQFLGQRSALNSVVCVKSCLDHIIYSFVLFWFIFQQKSAQE